MPTIVRDARAPWVHWVLGCVGLPWAAFCGDFVARAAFGTAGADTDRYYRYFEADRPFLVPLWLEPLVGKPLVFSLNNAWAMYYKWTAGVRLTQQSPRSEDGAPADALPSARQWPAGVPSHEHVDAAHALLST